MCVYTWTNVYYGLYVCRYALAAYLPIFFKRAHPLSNAAYSVANAVVISFGGATSVFAGGFLSDRCGYILGFMIYISVYICMCVCVCVCARARVRACVCLYI